MHSCSASRAFSSSAFSWFSFDFSATRSLNCNFRGNDKARRSIDFSEGSARVEKAPFAGGSKRVRVRAAQARVFCERSGKWVGFSFEQPGRFHSGARLLLELPDPGLVLHLKGALELHLRGERKLTL